LLLLYFAALLFLLVIVNAQGASKIRGMA